MTLHAAPWQICATIGLLAGASPAVAGEYVYTDIVLPSGYRGQALALNDRDQVIGFALMNQNGRFIPSFTWSDGETLVLDSPSSPILSDINKHGLCVGLKQSDGSGVTYNITTLKVTPVRRKVFGLLTDPKKINADGVILAGDNTHNGHERGVLLTHPGVTILHYPGSRDTTALVENDAGDVAGTFLANQDSQPAAFLYHNGSYTKLSIPSGTAPFQLAALDSQDTVAGRFTDQNNRTHGFTIVNGVFQVIDYPGANTTSTQVTGLGPHGELVGSYYQGPTAYGFIYADGKFTTIVRPGSIFTLLAGINKKLALAGTYVDQSNVQHAFIAVCPAGQSPCT